MKKCKTCKQNLPTSYFYVDKWKVDGLRPYCKECEKLRIKEIQSRQKLEWIALKGGGCQACDYNRYHGSLDFHHIVPEDKLFHLTMQDVRGRSIEEIQEELDKCILLCRNCHGEVHAGIIDISDVIFGRVA